MLFSFNYMFISSLRLYQVSIMQEPVQVVTIEIITLNKGNNKNL